MYFVQVNEERFKFDGSLSYFIIDKRTGKPISEWSSKKAAINTACDLNAMIRRGKAS